MPILDVAIGLSFFYLLLGLVCTTANEMLATLRKRRARFLERGIDSLLADDSALKERLFEHPLIRSLTRGGKDTRPSYIPADKFASALLDIVSGPQNPLTNVQAVKEGVDALNNPALRETMNALIARAGDKGDELHRSVEVWFNDGMDRVSGWYKRNAQWNSLLLASLITLIMNADTIKVTHTLWTNPVVRGAVVEQAKARASMQRPEEMLPLVTYENPDDPSASKFVDVSSPQQALTENEQKLLADLTGWAPDWQILRQTESKAAAAGEIIWNHGIGWILTALAVSLGAPFWFDTLNRFMNIRNAGRAPDEPRDKSSSASPGAQPAPSRG